jgi:hypothetical protein
MYAILRKMCPPLLANVLIGLWYAALLFLVLFFALEQQAEFRYINM